MSGHKSNTDIRRRDNSTFALEKFSLEQTLGKGAYAKVKLARCRDTGEKETVAVKIVDKKRSPKDYLSKFLCREMEIATIIQHKHIIEVYEILETDSKVYFVMELAEGGDLLDYINKRGSLQEEDARRILGQILMGLQHCHERGVVHRDLKCENILLDKSDNVKLTDFGFARKYKYGQCLETFCGSYAYASPQILNGEPYDGPSTDIWSVGIMLYAMVNGRLPFSDSNVRTLLRQIHGRLQFSKRVSQECKQLIRKMLAIRTDERISIGEIFQDPFMGKTPTPTATKSSASQPMGLLCATPHSTVAFRETMRESLSPEVTQQQVELLDNRECNSDVDQIKNSGNSASRQARSSTPKTSQHESTQSESTSEKAAARKLFEPDRLPPLREPTRKAVSQPSSQRSWSSQKSPHACSTSSTKPTVTGIPSRPKTPLPPSIQVTTDIARPSTPMPSDPSVPLDIETGMDSMSSETSVGSGKKGRGLFKKIKATFKKS